MIYAVAVKDLETEEVELFGFNTREERNNYVEEIEKYNGITFALTEFNDDEMDNS